jgi:tetratricopeptide (TPR) repeat protein
MAGVNEDRERQVVPLWRRFTDTNRRGELSSVSMPSRETFTGATVSALLADWKDQPGLSSAADLVSAALIQNRFKLANDAAEFIISTQQAPAAARSVAQLYLAEGQSQPQEQASAFGLPLWPEDPVLKIFDRLCDAVRSIKTRLIAYPHNPVLWTGLARYYTALGQGEKASRAIQIALTMAPDNRFVIRSASRFYLHQGDKDRAHWLLANAKQLKSDPWILAAEIATAAINGRNSQHIKTARRMVDGQRFRPFHLSEVASAIGTLESLGGSFKAGRKLIEFSLQEPAENAIAQAAWLSRKMAGRYIPQAQSTASFEANAWNAWKNAKWDQALDEARQWLFDQPFSSRPAILGSYLASAIMRNYPEAIEFARHGLRSNPGDFSLQNNLAVALALQGKSEEASNQVDAIDIDRLSASHHMILLATKGLVEFRSGRPETGRLLYRLAIDQGRRAGDVRESLAMVYWALEELRIRSPNAGSLREEALQVAAGLKDPGHLAIVARLSQSEASSAGLQWPPTLENRGRLPP